MVAKVEVRIILLLISVIARRVVGPRTVSVTWGLGSLAIGMIDLVYHTLVFFLMDHLIKASSA